MAIASSAVASGRGDASAATVSSVGAAIIVVVVGARPGDQGDRRQGCQGSDERTSHEASPLECTARCGDLSRGTHRGRVTGRRRRAAEQSDRSRRRSRRRPCRRCGCRARRCRARRPSASTSGAPLVPAGDARGERVDLALVARARRWCRGRRAGRCARSRRAWSVAPEEARRSSVRRSVGRAPTGPVRGPRRAGRGRCARSSSDDRRRRAVDGQLPRSPSTVCAAVATRPSPTTTPRPRSRFGVSHGWAATATTTGSAASASPPPHAAATTIRAPASAAWAPSRRAMHSVTRRAVGRWRNSSGPWALLPGRGRR